MIPELDQGSMYRLAVSVQFMLTISWCRIVRNSFMGTSLERPAWIFTIQAVGKRYGKRLTMEERNL
jgi:hypothetical protein